MRLTGLAVLAGFVAMSGSALLGAYFRGGEWPSDVYYGDVGAVSNYLVTVGPVLGLTVARLGHRHATRWLAVLGVPFLAVALLCAERALWPAIGVQAALVCVWGWRVRAGAVGWSRLALAGLIVLGLVGGGVYVSERYRTGGDPDSPMAMDNDSRPRVWKKVGEEILAHPLTGAGFGRGVLGKAYPALLPAAESRVFWHPHNLVLTYGVSAGVPGMVAVLALFASLAWRFWQLACRGERLARLAGLAGTVMVAGVLARNMTNDFFVRDGALLFWALAGMLFGYALRRPPASGADEADLRPARRDDVSWARPPPAIAAGRGRMSHRPAFREFDDVLMRRRTASWSSAREATPGAHQHARRLRVPVAKVVDDDTKWGMDAQAPRWAGSRRELGGRGSSDQGQRAAQEWRGPLDGAVVHPSAYVHPSAKLGRGTVVFAGAVVQPDAVIGDHVIVNTGATIDHDCIVGDYAHLAPGVHLAGAVQVGEGAFLGIGSVVCPGIKVGRWATLGAGGVAIRDVADGVVAVGIPARTLDGERPS